MGILIINQMMELHEFKKNILNLNMHFNTDLDNFVGRNFMFFVFNQQTKEAQ